MKRLSFESRNRKERPLRVESLENRCLLSAVSLAPFPAHAAKTALVAPAIPGSQVPQLSSAALAPMATTALRNVVGTYTGSISVKGVHKQAVTLTVTSQNADGTFIGTLTGQGTTVDVTGQVLPNNKITMTLDSTRHPGGQINGTGTGKISGKAALKLSLKMSFTSPVDTTGKLKLKM